MFNKKIILIISLLLLIVLALIFFISRSISNSVDYQLDRLANGTTEEKIIASDFMKNNKIQDAIPLLIDNINDNKDAVFKNQTKRTLPCASVAALRDITGEEIPPYLDACEEEVFQSGFDLKRIKDNWFNWHFNQQYKDWRIYRNEKLGFEINYPIRYLDTIGCNEGGDLYDLEYGLAPTKAFEGDNFVYIDNEYFFQTDGGQMINNGYRYKICNKINNSLAMLKNEPSWKIIIRDDIYNEKDLDNFIKEYYHQNCSLGYMEPGIQEGVFDVYITGKNGIGLDIESGSCPINYMTIFRYLPSQHKIATWNIGQEYKFWDNIENEITFDQAMVKSFKFLN
ncbi:MAG: hypothetical protein COV55_05055 [Candidatus Komeilibacteria bacterium CG11_big_fil_rev_8_21_14_0_20_36_20]|uniref:Uncharacterized protein n=1 Tax=Candidatus Komeilibacteria bacterium CG11_big_fil_rev_8_21_14_0_20_36_20 TaxID=1974477 RepID=A0A2H0NAZ2_9BACT|nr:MAG: hypothetical protein COV55_05055 [Candidatus Komeilibacteria bacterium CG11_big_fil_rev_8_21_14_0_20_36_20]PIR82069.1 MAG: hypothetical protein COU21_00290 [Candidatus Komeilibacteria bacterium CG10_big_fil_rev_8_21_14_0_10_36_65]PJC55048.1 MAG: hypothetical protein CO027_04275 [Candidatus Komeilibacteria bacterium CG_4_9_14_0_2_um_filter_36_13]